MTNLHDDNAPILVASALSRQVDYHGEHLTILKDASLSLARGQSLAIVGASGSGKSTLLALLAGLDRASGGEVTLFGEPLSRLDEDARAALRLARVGFVFQNFQLLPQLTALENVLLPLELAGHAGAEAAARAMLGRVGLGHRLGHYPRHLSGGQQQRVALARAFVGEPALLFADEPTGSLDAASGHEVGDLLFGMNREAGTALVLVTHDMKLAARCEQVLRIEDGVLGRADT